MQQARQPTQLGILENDHQVATSWLLDIYGDKGALCTCVYYHLEFTGIYWRFCAQCSWTNTTSNCFNYN
jgi:hypothetical protein